jgi:hypothetical protein
MLPLSDYERRILTEIESDFVSEACRHRDRRRLVTWWSLAVLCLAAATLVVLVTVRRLPFVVVATLIIVNIALVVVRSVWALRTRGEFFAALRPTRRRRKWRHGGGC